VPVPTSCHWALLDTCACCVFVGLRVAACCMAVPCGRLETPWAGDSKYKKTLAATVHNEVLGSDAAQEELLQTAQALKKKLPRGKYKYKDDWYPEWSGSGDANKWCWEGHAVPPRVAVQSRSNGAIFRGGWRGGSDSEAGQSACRTGKRRGSIGRAIRQARRPYR
jgi:hypothetical protein